LAFERYDNNNNIGNVLVTYESGEFEIMHTSPNCTWKIFKNKDFIERHIINLRSLGQF
jgi:hypothetical protein